MFAKTKSKARYWKMIYETGGASEFRGGARESCFKFSHEEKKKIELVLFQAVQKNPITSIPELLELIRNETSLNPSNIYIRRIFSQWRWTWKKPESRNINKYTPENMTYYGEFLLWIRHIPIFKLKYMDEAHFDVKRMFVFFNLHLFRMSKKTGNWSIFFQSCFHK